MYMLQISSIPIDENQSKVINQIFCRPISPSKPSSNTIIFTGPGDKNSAMVPNVFFNVHLTLYGRPGR